jgi:endonuclease/exonuclease/phosphatase family metal-dependent hydrolase
MAKPAPRRAFKVLFLIITFLVVLLYLLGCASIWFNPAKYWIMGFASLAFPYAVILLLLVCIFWIIAKPKFAWITFLILLFGYKQFFAMIGLNTGKEFVIKTNHGSSLRIATWNIQSFNGLSKNKEAKKLVRSDIQNSLTKYNPDVICLQEFNTTTKTGDIADNITLFSKEYPYHFFSADYQRKKGTYQSGCIIFSKLPFAATGKRKYPIAESLIFADIVKGNDTIRIYTTHLQSFKFGKEDYNEIDNFSATDASALASMSFVRKMKLAFKRRGMQADIVKAELAKSTYPTIICGDFNDVPNSYTYYTIKGNWQDAFLLKQLGFGRTFTSLSPTLRIDYILPDLHFDVKQFDMIDENLSDHFMLLVDIDLK